MAELEFVVLDVGQGTGTFLVVYGDMRVPELTVLIDLGSESARTQAGGPAAEYVVSVLKDMTTPTLDAIIFSHSDSDHINLIKEVLSQFDPPSEKHPTKPVLKVDYCAYGGDYDRYTKRGSNVIDLVRQYMDEDDAVTSFAACASDFAGSPVVPFFARGDLLLYLIIGNAAESDGSRPRTNRKRTDGFTINTNSLVVLVEYKGRQFVATGDATGSTLAQCNTVIKDWVRKQYLTDVLMLALPHHGSAATTFALKGLSTGVTPEDNLTRFVERIPTSTITSSAERVRRFKHPSARVMSFFWDDLTDKEPLYADPQLEGDRHFYTAYFSKGDEFEVVDHSGDLVRWPLFDWWYTLQTTHNVYTNVMYDQHQQAAYALPPTPGQAVPRFTPKKGKRPPAFGAAWCYTVDDDSVTLDPIVNRPNLLALRARIIADTYPERAEPPHWWGAVDLSSSDPDDLPALVPSPLRRAVRPPPPPDRRPPHARAAPVGLRRVRVLR